MNQHLMTSREAASHLVTLSDRMNETFAKHQRSQRAIKRARKLIEGRVRQAMQADIELTAARYDFAQFCQGHRGERQ